MSLFNKAVGSISETRTGVLSEWSLRLALAFLFFNHGLPKIEALISAPGEPFSYILPMTFFGDFAFHRFSAFCDLLGATFGDLPNDLF